MDGSDAINHDNLSVHCDLPEQVNVTPEELDLIEAHLRDVLIEMVLKQD